MTMAAPLSAAVPGKTRRIRLGGITALAQSAWMGFPLAADVLEPIRSAPAALRRWTEIIRPRRPAGGLRGLFNREFGIAEASFILMVSFFTSAALGAVRQVLFNAQFGVSAEANAYYAAFRLPDTLFSLIAGGALSSAMIPVLLSARQNDGERAAWRLVSLVLTALLAFMALVVLIVGLFTPFFVRTLLAPGFDATTSQLTVTLTRVMLVQPLVLAVGSVATAVLNSRNRFLPTALSIVSHNVA
ncbi:MAG TPA: lipid II flippase MurJ, partial [Promineifilum sp.]|nr:lipid II flippase MurJ [Promineifilum sp.]